jgi:hypothetical protein
MELYWKCGSDPKDPQKSVAAKSCTRYFSVASHDFSDFMFQPSKVVQDFFHPGYGLRYGGFLSHGGTQNHPVVMDDHGLVLKQTW